MAESSQSEKDQLYRCELCGKSFASKATYKQHLESRKHRENLRKFNEKKDNESEIREERSKTNTSEDQTVCLFCNKKSADIDENLIHMRLSHSFFISNSKNVKDLKGLLKYLGEKVHKKFICIYCNNETNKENKSGEGIQNHMLDKGHIFMDTDDFAEYERFYDFSKIINDIYKNNVIPDDEIIKEEDEEYFEIKVEQPIEEEEEGEWEVIDEEKGKVKSDTKMKVYRIRKAKVLDSGEILLPNGQILGNRAYRNLYKQYFREPARQSKGLDSIGYLDESTLAAREEENRILALEEKERRKERNANYMPRRQPKLGMKGGNVKPFFRPQVPIM